MLIKTSELTGAALDWAVAKCEGRDTRNNACVWFLPFEAESDDLMQFICMADDTEHAREQCEDAYPDCTIDRVEHINRFNPSTDWAQGGPIIEREGISAVPNGAFENNRIVPDSWCAKIDDVVPYIEGSTPLIAAMRCYVASKLGDEVDVPEEIC